MGWERNKEGEKEARVEQVEGGRRDGGELREADRHTDDERTWRSKIFFSQPVSTSLLSIFSSHMSLLTFTMHSRWSWLFYTHTPHLTSHTAADYITAPLLYRHTHAHSRHTSQINTNYLLLVWPQHVPTHTTTTTTKCTDPANQQFLKMLCLMTLEAMIKLGMTGCSKQGRRCSNSDLSLLIGTHINDMLTTKTKRYQLKFMWDWRNK